MNLLLFAARELDAAQQLHVTGARLRHLLDVLGAKAGDAIRVGEIGGRVGTGHIQDIDARRAILDVTLDQAPPPKLPLRLVLALPRPKMLRRILRTVAEFGVEELHLINAYRVEKSYWQTPVLQADTIRDYLLQGLAQSRDTVLPTVSCHRRFRPFVEDTLPGLIEGRRALLAHPGDHPACQRVDQARHLLVVGPEGGFIPYEVEKLNESGCETVSLGPRILRVENALVGLLGRLF